MGQPRPKKQGRSLREKRQIKRDKRAALTKAQRKRERLEAAALS